MHSVSSRHARDPARELDAAIQILGGLSGDDEVDAGRTPCDPREAPQQPQLRVHAETLAQLQVGRAEPAQACAHRTLERYPVPQDGFDDLGGNRLARARFERRCAHLVALPVDVDADRFDDSACRGNHLGSDAVAGDQRDTV